MILGPASIKRNSKVIRPSYRVSKRICWHFFPSFLIRILPIHYICFVKRKTNDLSESKQSARGDQFTRNVLCLDTDQLTNFCKLNRV